MRAVSPSVSRAASFRHAMRGVARLIATQANARIHVGAALLATILGIWLDISLLEWAVVSLTLGMVLGAEALNTAVEWVVDRVSPEWHPLARDAKDVAAGAVLITSLAALGVGGCIYLPKLRALF